MLSKKDASIPNKKKTTAGGHSLPFTLWYWDRSSLRRPHAHTHTAAARVRTTQARSDSNESHIQQWEATAEQWLTEVPEEGEEGVIKSPHLPSVPSKNVPQSLS